MRTLWQDVRYAARTLRKTPVFTAVAVITLTLGVGANTAIFSFVHGVLMRPLPYPDGGRLVSLASKNLRGEEGKHHGGVSPADFFDWRGQAQTFEAAGAYSGGAVVMTGAEQRPEMFSGTRVSDGFFEALGLRPALGRTFHADEFTSAGGNVIVLGHALWQRRFGGDPDVVGKSFVMNGRATTVVGVMPPEMKLPAHAEVWTPLAQDSGEMRLRGNRYFQAVARLRPGVTAEQARADVEAIAARLAAEHPKTNDGWAAQVTPLRQRLVGDVRPALLLLFGAVGLVLLIACANVSNLLLVRAAARRRELAVRLALGATRWRVARQLVAESLLLALAGGSAGLLLALWGVDALKALIPETLHFPRLEEVGVNSTAFAFTLGVSALTGLIFGLLPGWQAARPEAREALKESGRGATGGVRARRARSALVVAELALALVLLSGAGLLVRSFLELRRTEPGFDASGLLTFSLSVPQRYTAEKQSALFYREVLERVAAVPGVEGAAATTGTPLSGFVLSFPFRVEGREALQADPPQAEYSAVSPNYFRVMRVPLRAGREFSDRDDSKSPPVAIINETMARRFFEGEDPLGRRLTLDYLGRPLTLEVVGVAADVRQAELSESPEVGVYVPAFQTPWFSTMLVARVAGDPRGVVAGVREAVWSLSPDQPVEVRTMDEMLDASFAEPRLYTTLFVVFACVALLLASVGVYGVISYGVAQRTHEIGIRMALGARGRDVLRLVLRQGAGLALAGVAAGLAASFALTRLMESLLYGVAPADPLAFAAGATLLLSVALAACLVPARRATRVEPMAALRHE